VSDDSTAVLQGQLERAITGDPEARRRLLELVRDRLTRHARRLLHGPYARLGPCAQTDDVVQQRYLKVLWNQGRFWANARGQPVRSLADRGSAAPLLLQPGQERRLQHQDAAADLHRRRPDLRAAPSVVGLAGDRAQLGGL
jgi:hypothetical protein